VGADACGVRQSVDVGRAAATIAGEPGPGRWCPPGREVAIKFVDEYRDAGRARSLARGLAQEARPGRRYHFMEFCGGHTHAIARYGVEDLLPASVRMIHGPG